MIYIIIVLYLLGAYTTNVLLYDDGTYELANTRIHILMTVLTIIWPIFILYVLFTEIGMLYRRILKK